MPLEPVPTHAPFAWVEDKCTKKGGVCSFRLYEDADGVAIPESGAEAGLRVLCPRRFEEEQDRSFKWVGETRLGHFRTRHSHRDRLPEGRGW